jgi:transposase
MRERIFYVAKIGCQWDMTPKDLPAKTTVYDHYYKLKTYGLWDQVLEKMNRSVREKEGREELPTLGLVDSQKNKNHIQGTREGELMKIKNNRGGGRSKKWQVIPKRWIVERTFAWQQNFRRLSNDYEIDPRNSEAIAKVVAIRLNLKKLNINNMEVVKWLLNRA